MNRNANPNLFKIVHLNGCAGYYRKEPDNGITHWCGCDLTDPIQYNNLINLIEKNFYTNLAKPRITKNSISFAFEKQNPSKLIWLVPQRLIYRWLMMYVFFKAIKRAIKGELQVWGVLKRTGNVRDLDDRYMNK